MKSEIQRIRHESDSQKEKIKENQDKIKLNKQLPYLVGNVVEVLQLEGEEEEEEDGMAQDVDAQRTGKSVVIRTSTRQTIYLPVPGLVDAGELVPGDLVGTNKDSYLILEKLPAEYDSRVKAMEVDEKPSEEYSDIGGADKQITELVEAVVLPMTHKEMFDAIGIRPPKGVLLHGPPGTGKLLSVHCVSCLKEVPVPLLFNFSMVSRGSRACKIGAKCATATLPHEFARLISMLHRRSITTTALRHLKEL